MSRWIADVDGANTWKYHTDRDCPYFPSKVREVEEADLRRDLTECSWCSGSSILGELEYKK